MGGPGHVPWWRFWNPLSGLPGGLIMGAVLAVPLLWWLA